ncbi:hypothetical protein IC235_01335 [Hymenobacter sp. BT664]|uniref:Tetratricopeptide repeat protein n=1 Tax=Hymenobacter montanus TaxID=2771359 RepID=A0A927B9U9_9BACT|nr:DUF6340 family protein [Hymenobacter montanus]MBD2766531.1 hypothetical protein [Hymenobacter montanus]
MIKILYISLSALVALLLSACASTIQIQALAPAAVQMPDNLQSVATANRIIPTSSRNKFFDVLEGVFTGEGIGVDRAGADECVNVVGQALANNSYRFKVKQAQLQLLGRSREFFLPPLEPRYIKNLCRQNNVDGLVVLEAFDSDMALSHTNGSRTVKDKEGRERQIPTVYVEMIMKVVTGFRTYGGAEGFILDQAKLEDRLAFSAEGDTYQDALRRLPPPEECIRRVAQVAGDRYARRIAPSYVNIARTYFSSAKGDPLMKQAALRADTRDWKGAEDLWKQAARNLNPTIAGRAFYNLAVASEVRGDLPSAVEWAKKSAYTCNNRQARGYLMVLNNRMREQELIREQLKSLPINN